MAAHEDGVTVTDENEPRAIEVRADRFEYSRSGGLVNFWEAEEIVAMVSDPFLVSVVRRDAR